MLPAGRGSGRRVPWGAPSRAPHGSMPSTRRRTNPEAKPLAQTSGRQMSKQRANRTRELRDVESWMMGGGREPAPAGASIRRPTHCRPWPTKTRRFTNCAVFVLIVLDSPKCPRRAVVLVTGSLH